MSSDDKQVRKVVQCVCTLLEAEGVKVGARKVAEVLKGEDLNDPVALTAKVKASLDGSNDMRAPAADGPSERQQRIETFMTQNWAQIRDDEIVRAALLDAYCKGRIKKDKRQEMQDELVKRCEGSVSTTAVVRADSSEDEDSTEFNF